MGLAERAIDMVRNAITRGRLTGATMTPRRVLLQGTGVYDETKQGVELVLPFGMSANPGGNGDLFYLQIAGTRDHLAALLDDSALHITDLQIDEFGFKSRNGLQIAFRQNGIQVLVNGSETGLMVTGNGGAVLGGNLVQAANDAAAQAAGVPVNGFYRNGNGVQIRLV